MPLSRYRIRNEYSLADSELYRAADKDDPEDILEAVAMAGLVGVLRQLGDLAEFAAEIFHDLHEEVMATAARGHGLMARVQQLEAEFPSIEKAFLSQTSHSSFFYNAGTDWHPNLHMDQNLITRGDLPRFIMDSYEECRGPPRLFLLDKFDVAGAGACLKRYTDPSFFKVELLSSSMTTAEAQREKKIRKAKKKGSRWRNGETPEILPASHAKLHQLFLEERVENGTSDPARRVKLKRKLNGFPFDTKSGESYMQKFLKDLSPEHKLIHETSGGSSPLKLPWNVTIDSGLVIHEISTVNSDKESEQGRRSLSLSPNIEGIGTTASVDSFSEDVDDGEILALPELSRNFEANTIPSTLHRVVEEKEILVDGGSKTKEYINDYQSDELTSEMDNYMDALAAMDSEMEIEAEPRAKNYEGFLNAEKQGTDSDSSGEQLHTHFSDSQSVGNSTASDDGINSSKKGIFSSSYSDSPRTSADNMPFDGDFSRKAFPPTEICEAEVTEKSSEHISVNQGVLLTEPPENKLSDDAPIKVAKISSCRDESSEPFSSSSLADPAPTISQLDQRSPMRKDKLAGEQMDEVISNCDEINTRSINYLENGTDMLENSCGGSNLSDRTDGLPPLVSSENHSVDKLDSEGPNAFSAASIHFSNILEEAYTMKSMENSSSDVLKAEYAENNYTEDLIQNQISPLHLVISPTEKPLFSRALRELESCKQDVNAEAVRSDADYDVPFNGDMETRLSPAEDSPDTHDLTKSQVSEMVNDVVTLSTDSAEVDNSFFKEQFDDRMSDTVNAEEMGETIPSIDMVETDVVSPNPALLAEFRELLDSEAVVSSAVVTVPNDDTNGNNDANSFSMNLRKLPDSSFGVLDQNELVINETCLSENHEEFGSSEQASQKAVSPDFNSFQCNTVCSDHSESQFLNNFPDLGIAPMAENSLNLGDATLVPLSSGNSGQDSESKSNQQGNTVENAEDALSSVLNQQPIASPDLNLFHTVSASHSELQLLNGIPNSSLAAEGECSLCLDDDASVPSSSEDTGQNSQSISHQLNSSVENTENASSLPASAEPKILVDWKVNSQDEQLVMQAPQKRSSVENTEDASYLPAPVELSFQVVQKLKLQANQLDMDSHQLVDNTGDASSFPAFAEQRISTDKKAGLLSDQVDGKSLHVAETSLESFSQSEHGKSSNHLDHERQPDASSECCPTNFPIQSSALALLPQPGSHKFDIPAQSVDPLSSIFPGFGMLSETTQINLEEMPPLPPLPPIQWRMGKLQEAPPFLDSDAVQNQMDSLQHMLPSSADYKAQIGCSRMQGETTQPSDPFLPHPSEKRESSQHVYEHVQGNMVHSNHFSLQTPTMVNLGHSHNSLISDKTHPVNSFLTLPATFNVMPQHDFHTVEGERIQTNLSSCSSVSAIGNTASTFGSGSSQDKFFQSQHQVAPEASFEDKMLEQNSGISEGKVLNSCDSISLSPIIEDGQLPHFFPILGAQSASSALEEGNPNVSRPGKLPRPRNPLIDAVVAHDKSKLRKVTDRVRPQIQKVEERDSLLEQIRTKSFNLKPAAVSRPNIQGPKTNLKVAAILEKANAIRQALAGSDEDDEEDCWSDS